MTSNLMTRRATVLLVGFAASHVLASACLLGQETADKNANATRVPDEAVRTEALSSTGVTAIVGNQTIWLSLDSSALEKKQAIIPRLCAPIRSMQWKDQPKLNLKFVPEPTQWIFSWNESPSEHPIIEVVLDGSPMLLDQCPPATSAGDGSVMLHAAQASTFGEKLRFEPQWFKNTVGYWTVPTDYATWELVIDQPGVFSVAVLQGCGGGQGGSEARITLHPWDDTKSLSETGADPLRRDQDPNTIDSPLEGQTPLGTGSKAELSFETIDTGHFQNFRWNHLGNLKVDQPGKYRLTLSPIRIAKAALFDVRMIHLVRQAKEIE